MKTDPTEEFIKNLPWRQPPVDLKERIFSPTEERPVAEVVPMRRGWSRMGWAAALVAGVFVAGYGIKALMWGPTPSGEGHLQVAVPVESLEVGDNFFDFTSQAQDPWPGEMRFQLQASSNTN